MLLWNTRLSPIFWNYCYVLHYVNNPQYSCLPEEEARARWLVETTVLVWALWAGSLINNGFKAEELPVSSPLTCNLIKEGMIVWCVSLHVCTCTIWTVVFVLYTLGCVWPEKAGPKNPPLVYAHRIFGFPLQSYFPWTEVRGDGSQGRKDSRHCVQIRTICSNTHWICI